ncbi:hypothetical protein TRVA0_013S00188 [Trichomonascus vanleenenianus]|uniref:uncharacterized protein n=1 Tax=Trichomonascus vanleenenianus TaxID=2268995 RepID=UPI003ECA949C
MSRRYRQSSRHTGQYLTDLDDKIKGWQREWTSPLLNAAAASAPATAVTNGSATKSQQNTPAPGSESPPASAAAELNAANKKLYSFSVKMWVRVDEEGVAVEDGDAGDVLDLSSSTQRARMVDEDKSKSEGGLTAADIRGAVGGEAIPGIVSAQYDTQKKEETPKEPSREPPKEPEPTQPEPEKTDENKEESKREEIKQDESKPEEEKQEIEESAEKPEAPTADKMDVDEPKQDEDVSMENA